MRNIARRLSALEARRRLSFPQRVVVRYERGPEDLHKPEEHEEEIDENTLVVIVQYMEMPIQVAEGAC